MYMRLFDEKDKRLQEIIYCKNKNPHKKTLN